MSVINLKIITPERIVFEGQVDQATLPVSDGEVTILPHHRSYIASLKIGEITVKKDGDENNIAVAGGFLEFADDQLTVLADEAVRAEEIDLAKAEEARKRAQEIKDRVLQDDTDYARVAAALEKEMLKIKIAKKYLTRRGL